MHSACDDIWSSAVKQNNRRTSPYDNSPLVLQTQCRIVHILLTTITSDVWILTQLWARLQLGNDGVYMPLWASLWLLEGKKNAFPWGGEIITV